MTAVFVPTINERKRIPQKAIRDLVQQIAEQFNPQKIILFGSYAHGKPRPESDVDLLVITNALGSERRPSLTIRKALNIMFGLDLIVYTPTRLQQRLDWGDSFLREIMETGVVMYESADT